MPAHGLIGTFFDNSMRLHGRNPKSTSAPTFMPGWVPARGLPVCPFRAGRTNSRRPPSGRNPLPQRCREGPSSEMAAGFLLMQREKPLVVYRNDFHGVAVADT